MTTTREAYQLPQIIKHDRGIGNQFGGGLARKVLTDIEGVACAKLVADHGSPVFVYAERVLRERAREALRAFTKRYPKVRFGWSYKTNNLDAICGIFHQEGWGAEVVSAAEYAMARRLGVPGNAIVYNGACKPVASLKLAAEEGALIQIDHFDELTQLEAIAKTLGKPLAVGIRVNMRVEALGMAWDRFGFNLESGEALDAARRITRAENMKLVGLHCHLGTYVDQPEAYRQSARRLGQLALEIKDALGVTIEIVNLGGGFPSRSALHTSYTASEDQVPDIEKFAEAITRELKIGFRGREPLLILESGRALVEDAGTLLTTIVGTRRMPGGGRGLVLDAGVNILYTSNWYRHDVLPTEKIRGQIEQTTLHGPLCMAIDVVRQSVPLPPLEWGHVLAIRSVGAYNVTQWMQWSQLRPAVIMISPDGVVEVIRRGETLDDMKGPEKIPERFKTPKVERLY